jgi:hypothetical protein
MTAEERARAQTLYRAANERIARSNRKLDPLAPFEVVCECGARGCARDRIWLAPGEYDRIRADPTHFVVVPAHVDDGAAVVRRGDGYVVTAVAVAELTA